MCFVEGAKGGKGRYWVRRQQGRTVNETRLGRKEALGGAGVPDRGEGLQP